MARNKKQKKVKIDKYSKVEPQISKGVIIGIVSFVVVMLALLILSTPNNQQKVYNAYKPYVTSTYFTKDHPFYMLSTKELNRKIDKDDVVILYIGNEQCPACVQSIGAFQRYFNSEGMNEHVTYVYYINPVLDIDGFNALMAKHAQIQDVTPQLLMFINGEIVLTYQAPAETTEQSINQAARRFFVDAIKLIP